MRDYRWEAVIEAAAAVEDIVERSCDDSRRQQVRGEIEGIVTVFDCAPVADAHAYAIRRLAEAMLAAIDAEERDWELADFDDDDDEAEAHASNATGRCSPA